jgi:uncharacterized protein YlxW (UPF0749 family)
MFIPNKTINLIKTLALIVLSMLVVVIVGQSVLYLKLSNANKTELGAIKSEVNISKKFDTLITTNQRSMETDLVYTQKQVDSLNQEIKKLQNSVDGLLFKSDILIKNECSVRPYYMEKQLIDMCPN